MKTFEFQEHPWPQIRPQIAKIDKPLATLIDHCNPSKDHTLIELHYPFGSHIWHSNQGGFQIPDASGETVSLDHADVPKGLQQKLGYQALPLGMIMQGGAEVYHEWKERVSALAFWREGLCLGLGEMLGGTTLGAVVAGARSLWFVPRVADRQRHRKLQLAWDLKRPAARDLFGQWRVFVDLARQAREPWRAKLLFFTHKWWEPKQKNLAWQNFYRYLQEKACSEWLATRLRSAFEMPWNHFCQRLQQKGERFDPYLMETLKHLIFIAKGMTPAFAPVAETTCHGPTQFLMNAYLNHYGLKPYAPTLLAPAHFKQTFAKNQPVYYSLQNPTLLNSLPKSKSFSSAVDDLRQLKLLMDYFIEENLGNSFLGNDKNFWAELQNVRFDYFHSEMFSYGGILPSARLPAGDRNLVYVPGGEVREFADKASFFRCCVRVMGKV